MNIAWSIGFRNWVYHRVSEHTRIAWFIGAIIGAAISTFLPKALPKRVITVSRNMAFYSLYLPRLYSNFSPHAVNQLVFRAHRRHCKREYPQRYGCPKRKSLSERHSQWTAIRSDHGAGRRTGCLLYAWQVYHIHRSVKHQFWHLTANLAMQFLATKPQSFEQSRNCARHIKLHLRFCWTLLCNFLVHRVAGVAIGCRT